MYSLGIVLTELLTGERPTGGEPAPATDLERVIARARAADPSARHQLAAELRDELRAVDLAPPAAAPAAPRHAHRRRRRAAGPLTAVRGHGRRRRRRGTHADRPTPTADADRPPRPRAPGATAVLPAATAVATALTPPPPRPPSPAVERRRFRRAKTTYPKVAKAAEAGQTPEAAEAAEARARRRRSRPWARRRPPGPAPAKRERTWKARHWAVILAAPLLLVVGGAIAYAKLTEHAPMAKVPDVVDRDVFSAASILKSAGFEVDSVAADSPRPGGTILDQDPGNGKKLEQGSTVRLTVSRTRATVPYVVTMGLGDAKVALAKRGFLNLTVTPDYRDDVDVGHGDAHQPRCRTCRPSKSAAIEVVVAADPHVELRDVVGVDQRTATEPPAGRRAGGRGADRQQQDPSGRHGAEVEPGRGHHRGAGRHHHHHRLVGAEAGERRIHGRQERRRRGVRPRGRRLRGAGGDHAGLVGPPGRHRAGPEPGGRDRRRGLDRHRHRGGPALRRSISQR